MAYLSITLVTVERDEIANETRFGMLCGDEGVVDGALELIGIFGLACQAQQLQIELHPGYGYTAFADSGANAEPHAVADGHYEPDANREPDGIAFTDRDREPIGGALAIAERGIRRSGARAGAMAHRPGARRGGRRGDLRLVPEPGRDDRRRRRD